jgi:polyhydroxybutyrate depolymerase
MTRAAWTHLAMAALAAALWSAPAAACPGLSARCLLPQGHYRALTPEATPKGLVLFLHGWGGTAEDALKFTEAVRALLARGYVVAAPQGEPRAPGDAGGRWNAEADPERRDDRAFLRAVIADARARLRVGDGPAMVAGFSAGGMMVWRLACDDPGAADAYAPVAGLLWRPLPDRCAGPVRLLHVHGWSDSVVPLEGRAVGGGRIVQGDLFDGLALMRATHACETDKPTRTGTRPPFLLREWTGCPGGGALAFALFDGGHVTPAGWGDLALDWLEGADMLAAAR